MIVSGEPGDPGTLSITGVDVSETLDELRNREGWKKGVRQSKALVKDERQRVTLHALPRGTNIKPHHADGPITVQVVEGSMKFVTPERIVRLEKGQLLTLEAGVEHSVESIGEVAFVVTVMLQGDDIKPNEVQISNEPNGGVMSKAPTDKRQSNEHRRLLPADGKPVRNLKEYEATGGLAGLRKALTMTPEQILDELKRSGLRGRGGAGFPTFMKWDGVINGGRGRRYVCCNGAEGEPGTFKDRFLLQLNPYPTLEGLAIAAHAVGAERIFIAIKKIFTEVAERLKQGIEELHKADLLPNGKKLKIELVLGPEEYLFGEEKALMEVVEGNLPLPRWLAPYMSGLFREPLMDNPTLINNAETLANVTLIMRNGAEWFRQVGPPKSPGTMIFTVCGDVERPGCYELPLGTPMRDLIEKTAGGMHPGCHVKGIFSGVSNGVLMPDKLDTSLDFDSLRAVGSGLGSGGFIVYDDSVCMVKAAAMFSRFLYVESCGQCPPCKFSSGEITERLNKLESGVGTPGDIEAIAARCATVDQGTPCALPTGERLVVGSFIRKFSEEFHAHCGSVCTLPRELQLPKLASFDEKTGQFIYDQHQQPKQPDWSYEEAETPAFM